MERIDFLNNIGYFGIKYAPKYGFKCISPMIAQAILETGWHHVDKEDGLFPYNNFFGLKCGGAWSGKSVNMATKEEYNGNMVDIRDNFRVFDTFEEGVEGYFDFLDWSNYSNLKGVSDPYTYLELIKKDGYATASNYVDAVYRIIDEYDLKEWDKKLENPSNYHIGDEICFTKLHRTAHDDYPLIPYRVKGTITKVIEGAKNPYLIDDNIGWVRECDIVDKLEINVGDIVKVNNPISYTGEELKLWHTLYEVIEVQGDRAVIGVEGVVTAAINISNIERV